MDIARRGSRVNQEPPAHHLLHRHSHRNHHRHRAIHTRAAIAASARFAGISVPCGSSYTRRWQTGGYRPPWIPGSQGTTTTISSSTSYTSASTTASTTATASGPVPRSLMWGSRGFRDVTYHSSQVTRNLHYEQHHLRYPRADQIPISTGESHRG